MGLLGQGKVYGRLKGRPQGWLQHLSSRMMGAQKSRRTLEVANSFAQRVCLAMRYKVIDFGEARLGLFVES